MNCLFLYNATQTYTATVHEHLAAFARYSRHRHFYVHHDSSQPFALNLGNFDVIAIHYSVRLPYDQISESAAAAIAAFGGLRVLFIQDEYNHTHRAWYWIKRLCIDLVFSVVPAAHLERVYPAREFPGTRFVSVLTGYVPETIPTDAATASLPSNRQLLVGYRGRDLPLEYGQLGREKLQIGQLVRAYAQSRGLGCDIEWTEARRIYGPDWYRFIASCRAMLGSESGSNVFDWDGTLPARIAALRKREPLLPDEEVYTRLVAPLEEPGLMNQISPRIFEAISLHTVLVLYEGQYSGVLQPDVHYLSLRKDGSNLADVFEALQDDERVDTMAKRAFRDIIGSGRWSYASFVALVDEQLESGALSRPHSGGHTPAIVDQPTLLATLPIRAQPPTLPEHRSVAQRLIHRGVIFFWSRIPESFRARLRPGVRRLRSRL